MCQLKENSTFIEENGVFHLNKEFLKKEPFLTTNFITCNQCCERANGFDEFGLPWCYTPSNHPTTIFPMVQEIIYEEKKEIA